RSHSFLAAITTARSPVADMAASVVKRADGIGRLTADSVRRLVGDGEDRLEAGYLKNLAHGWSGSGQLKVAALLPRLAMSREQDVDAGRVAEIHPRQVDDETHRVARRQRAAQ